MGRHSTILDTDSTISPSRKRKREISAGEEIEVDVTAPEPPSKKALRKAKKGRATPADPKSEGKTVTVQKGSQSDEDASVDDLTSPKRSEHGIWIGNLPWTATKTDLRHFLTQDTGISDDMITRLYLPAPGKGEVANSRQKIKPQNKGFAYVDFSVPETLTAALALSEKLLTGRRLLIKDSKSFEGRPERNKKEEQTALTNGGKPPSKRIFVGNLAFETTMQDLREQFARCGEVRDIHVATFEDTGKCKGYAWIEFAELAAGEAAVRGWVDFERKDEGGDEYEESSDAVEEDEAKPKQKRKMRKWWVNKLHGRPLKLEFAEGKDIRYKKRYGKDGNANKDEVKLVESDPKSTAQLSFKARTSLDRKAPRKIDARTIRPGAALAAAPRWSGGIVESQGKKTTFA